MTKNRKKFTAGKNLIFLGSKIKLQEKPSALKREHPALQNMKFLHFFLFLQIIFALLDLDPEFETGAGSTDLVEFGSDPDPKHCIPALHWVDFVLRS